MKRKGALQGIALLLTLSTTTSVFASDIKVEIVGGGDINIYNTKKEEATELPTIQEEIEKDKPIPYTEEEYQYLMINFTEPYTEGRYNQLIENKESFVISDSRLIQKNIKSSIYLNDSTFHDDAFRKELSIVLNVNENDIIPLSKLNIIEMNINSQNHSIMYLNGIEHFKSLQKIVIPNQNIQSSSISNIAFLPLKYLDLRGNNIISVEDFKYLTQLEYLDLYDNALGTYYNWITNLKYCKKLKYLNLGGSQRLEDTGVLRELVNLETLILSGSSVDDTTFISDLVNLKHLQANSIGIGGRKLPNISKLVKLEELQWSSNNETDISLISNLTNLKVLNISNNQINNISPISNLTNLEVLYIDNNTFDKIQYRNIPKTNNVLEIRTDAGINASTYTSKEQKWYTDSNCNNIRTSWEGSGYLTSYIMVKKLISIDRVDIEDKIYNGETGGEIKNISFTGLDKGDILTEDIDYKVTATFDNKNVGNNKNVTVKIQLLNTTKAKKYELNQNNITTTGNIIKANSTIDGIKIMNSNSIETTTFDFSENLVIEATPKLSRARTQIKKMELLLNEKVIATENASENNKTVFNIKLNDLPIDSGTYELKLKFGGDDNLNSSQITLGNITINPIKIKAKISEQFIYNGQNSFTADLQNIKNKKDSSQISKLKGTAKVTLNSRNVGSYNTFTISDINLVGDKANHYSIEDSSKDITGNIVINKKPITINSAIIEDKKYDGNTNANVVDIKFNDLINNENLIKGIDYNVTGTFNDKNAGSNKPVTVVVQLLNTQKVNNYQLTNNSFTTVGNITKANSTIAEQGIVEMKKEFIYGENIDINVAPKIKKLRSVDFDKIQLIYNNEILASGSYDAKSNKYKLSYNTEDKKLPISNDIPIKVKFTGNNNLNASEYETTICLKPREISATYDLNYNYDNESTKETNLKLNGVLPKDKLDVLATLYLDEDKLNVNDNATVKNIDYKLNDSYYILPKENITGNITINKANIETQKSSLNIVNKLEKDYIFNLEENLPILENNKTFGNIAFNNLQYNEIKKNYLKEIPILEDNNLIIKVNEINSTDEKLVGTITLDVTTTNYNNFKLEIDLKTTNKVKPILNITQKYPLTYGDNLNKLQLDYKATYEGKAIDGTLKINEDLEKILNAGIHKINITFIPNDKKLYDLVNTNVNIKVDKARAKLIEQPKTSEVNKQEIILKDIKFLNNGKFEGINKETLKDDSYSLKWENENEVIVENQFYKYDMIHDNYYIDEEIILIKNDNNSGNEENINNGNGVNIGNKPNLESNNKEENYNKSDSIFDDLDDDYWAKDKIEYLANKGIVKGYNKLIRPNEPITRAEFAILLNNTCNYLGVETNNISNKIYTDVLKNKYYYNDIYKATYLDTMIGYNDATFKPENNLVRQEAIVSICKLITLCNLNIEINYPIVINDYEDISYWARPYFNDLNSKGIIKGYNGNFKPKEDITRAEAFVLVYNILNL